MNASAQSPFGSIDRSAILLENTSAVAFLSPAPISEGHAVVAPKRVVARIDELTEAEELDLWRLARDVRRLLESRCRPEGISIGLNDGEAAGQTVAHAHVFVVPRYALANIKPPKRSMRPAEETGEDQPDTAGAVPESKARFSGLQATPENARRWIGVDLSGDAGMWAPTCSNSDVWIATLAEMAGKPAITDLRKVQDLEGEGTPFQRLVALLSGATFEAAGIAGPFSLPALTVPSADHLQLLQAIYGMDVGEAPFPTATQLLEAFGDGAAPEGRNDFRSAEDLWQSRGIKVRPTLWNGEEPGAPLTAACLRLLALAGRPVWPFAPAQKGCLVEALPHAQLKTWGIPHTRYAGSGSIAIPNRQFMVKRLGRHMDFNGARSQLVRDDSALDAAVAAFAAMAVTEDRLAFPPVDLAFIEGWIAVHI